MRELLHTYTRILAIAPGPRGFGYAVLEGQGTLIDWGIKAVLGEKNKECLEKVEEMIAFYEPHVLVMKDHKAKKPRRSERLQTLSRHILTLAKKKKLPVKVFSRIDLMHTFFPVGKGTKHALAQIISSLFPEELSHRLPHKRRAWESESYSMNIFEAVALGIALQTASKKS